MGTSTNNVQEIIIFEAKNHNSEGKIVAATNSKILNKTK